MNNVNKFYAKPTNKIEAIFIDLDGTLLTRNKTIASRSILSIKKALAKGIDVYLISGRPYFFVADIASRIDHRCIPIGFNGAYYYLNDRLEEKSIARSDFFALMEGIKQCNINKYYIKSNTTIYCSDDDSRFTYDTYAKDKRITVKTNVSDVDSITSDVYKVLIIDTNDKLDALKHMNHSNLTFTSSHNQSLEVMADHVDKGETIKAICQIKGYCKQSLMAIGDGLNDCAMFDQVQYRIAMDNAIASLKEKANYITLSNDNDGVAVAIEKFCFEHE